MQRDSNISESPNNTGLIFFNAQSCSLLLCFLFDHYISFVCVNIFNGLLMKNSFQLLNEACKNWKVSKEGHLHISDLANLCVYVY